MRMSRLSLLFPAVLALALGGCFSRGPHAVQDQSVPAAEAAEPAGVAAAPAPVVYAASPATAYPAPLAEAPARRGIFTANLGGPFARAPAYPRPCDSAGCAAAAAPAYAAYPQPMQAPYLLDAGDRLRITVFGQDGLTNSYAVDAAGNITMPLVGTLPARGLTTAQLSRALSERLKRGYIREPKLAIEVEAYRPFFIYGEVATSGQY